VSARDSEVHQGQSCFNIGWTTVYTKRRKVVVICLNTTSTKISAAFVLCEPAAHKTNGIEDHSSFQVSNPFLLSILSLALYTFLVTFFLKCFLDPFYAMSEEWRKVYQSGSSRLNSQFRKRKPVKLSSSKDVEEKI
jgi:hypothetical protein